MKTPARRVKTAVERGIRRDSMGYEAYVTAAGRYQTKRFPPGTPLEAMRRWREETRSDLSLLGELQPAKEVENLPRSLSGWCYVYFLRSAGLVKIGRAVNVQQRVRELQTGHHRPLEVLAVIPAHAALEHAIHERFARARQSGEWFILTDELQEFIRKCQNGANPVALLW